MEKITICRCCKNNQLLSYLNLGNQPLANWYQKKKKSLPQCPLRVMLCPRCFHSQLSIVVNPDSMFKNYLYVSGTTTTFNKHCERLAIDAVKRIKKKSISVLDIACNDGTQLMYFKKLGCEVLGVDPAQNLRELTKRKNIPVEVDYWSPALAKRLGKKFDIVTGTNVFAHVNDLDEFLKGIKLVLTKDGVLILEFPYADKMIKYNEFDTVYHEHLSYFLVNSFKTLMDRAALTIVDVLQTTIHGGSIRFFVKNKVGRHTKKVYQLIQNEKAEGLLNVKSYSQFAQRIKKNKKDTRKLIKEMESDDVKIIGYGASAKGNTMLNYFKINLDYIVDDNPLKWGYLTPGRNILINNPEIIRHEKKNLAIIILSWNFYNEVIKKIQLIYEGKKDADIILYVPTIKVLTLKSANR